MDGYIKRRTLLDAIENLDWYKPIGDGRLSLGAASEDEAVYKAKDIFKVVESLPAADVASARHGKWEDKSSGALNLQSLGGTLMDEKCWDTYFRPFEICTSDDGNIDVIYKCERRSVIVSTHIDSSDLVSCDSTMDAILRILRSIVPICLSCNIGDECEPRDPGDYPYLTERVCWEIFLTEPITVTDDEATDYNLVCAHGSCHLLYAIPKRGLEYNADIVANAVQQFSIVIPKCRGCIQQRRNGRICNTRSPSISLLQELELEKTDSLLSPEQHHVFLEDSHC